MGLVARAVEQAGLATVALSLLREVAEKIPPPRALFVRFPFGHALGKPGDRNEHFAVLALALNLLFEAQRPGTVADAGFRWKRETYPEPDWDFFRGLGPGSARSETEWQGLTRTDTD
ncbi:MAG: hypothetical protein HY900_23350 [Deltaproteobacteria bacterium]|nr:hypothetical protein [Deltaproteobacteria bacterium]